MCPRCQPQMYRTNLSVAPMTNNPPASLGANFTSTLVKLRDDGRVQCVNDDGARQQEADFGDIL